MEALNQCANNLLRLLSHLPVTMPPGSACHANISTYRGVLASLFCFKTLHSSYWSTFFTVQVGSVEEFQGHDNRAFTVSTVWSSVQHLQFDTKHR